MNPRLQLYMAFDPGVVPITITMPFTGSVSGPQSGGAGQKEQLDNSN